MIRLYIDNCEADLDQESSIAISLSVNSVTVIDRGKTAYSKQIKVPMTARNGTLFGDVDQPNAVAFFNQQPHVARIEAEGSVVLEGTPYLVRCETETGGRVWYYINIIGSGREWIRQAMVSLFRELPIPLDTTITAVNLYNDWINDAPVKFLPVQRDILLMGGTEMTIQERMLTFEDYHPFVSAKAILEAIATQAGYTIDSEFLKTPFFKSLHVSGRYPEKEVEALKERSGFKAARLTEKSAAADHFGRVYANPYSIFNSVGNIVETADPEELASDAPIQDLYNQNGVFTIIGGGVRYKPAELLTAGFEYLINYRSDYKIKNRTELTCFDTLLLEDNITRKYRIVNKFVDYKTGMVDRMNYLAMVFNHQPGAQYKLTCQRSDNNQEISVKIFSTRSIVVGTALGVAVKNATLWIQNSQGAYERYAGDWALYEGYVLEQGTVDIEIQVRTGSKPYSPTTPTRFDNIYFGGAEQGMSMTLTKKGSLKPIFVSHPTEQDRVTFTDIAMHEVYQVDFVHALKQLFNLQFYLNNVTKTIYIEPRDSFFVSDVEVDWSDRIDRSRPITNEELGADVAKEFVLDYQREDGSVDRWDESKKQRYGRWSGSVQHLFAQDGLKTYRNPLFNPTLNKSGGLSSASNATLIQVGDRNRKGVANEIENLNFPLKIVSFTGMQPLPQGQYWGWPSYTTSYPQVLFHHPLGSNPMTLCFENRDGVTGLHSYYDSTLALYNQGRRITAYINLAPHEVEALLLPNTLKRDFRALFKLKIGGESICCRLEEVVDYNPARKGATLCIFIKER